MQKHVCSLDGDRVGHAAQRDTRAGPWDEAGAVGAGMRLALFVGLAAGPVSRLVLCDDVPLKGLHVTNEDRVEFARLGVLFGLLGFGRVVCWGFERVAAGQHRQQEARVWV